MNRIRGSLVLPDGIVPGEIAFDDRIREVTRLDTPASASDRPFEGTPLILPGFVDVHVHGGGGGDAMDGPDGVRTLAAFHARHGTTTIYPTTITHPVDDVLAALRGIREVADEDASAPGRTGGRSAPGEPARNGTARNDTARSEPVRADVPGGHLEGPFISPERLGAQPPFAVPATADRVAAFLDTGAVRVVTLAPEIEGVPAAAETFAAADVRVSVGHTAASYEQVAALMERVREAGGSMGFTHLYNAMGILAARAPGVVGAAFAHAESWCELILDLHHVHAASARAAWAAKGDHLVLVTDAIRAAGLPEGDTELGGQHVVVSGGAARLANGSLAGSVLTMDAAVRNAVSIGLPLHRASWASSAAPAAYMGLTDRGRLEPGLRADLVLLDARLHVSSVYVAGREVA